MWHIRNDIITVLLTGLCGIGFQPLNRLDEACPDTFQLLAQVFVHSLTKTDIIGSGRSSAPFRNLKRVKNILPFFEFLVGSFQLSHALTSVQTSGLRWTDRVSLGSQMSVIQVNMRNVFLRTAGLEWVVVNVWRDMRRIYRRDGVNQQVGL